MRALAAGAFLLIAQLAAAQPADAPAPVAAAPAAAAATDDLRYWRLVGGGEVVGRLAKETPSSVFVDIGPTIVELATDAIAESRGLNEPAASGTTPAAGTGTGVFDPETGSVIFHAREDSGTLRSKAEVVEQAKRSVVLISNPRGRGSGWVLDKEGRVVTNHHVIDGESFHSVTFFRKRADQWERVRVDNVEVEAYSPLFDIALLKLTPEQMEEHDLEPVPMPIAAPGSLQVGDPVFAIGNPGMGGRTLDHSVSEGIASALARNFGDMLYIQTTAAVNPGNSGGPLVNARGEAVGLVTLRATFQEGIAFALPVELIRVFLHNSESYAFSSQSPNKGFRYLTPP